MRARRRSRRLVAWLVFTAISLVTLAASAGPAACQTRTPCQSDSDCGAGTRCVAGAATVCTAGPDGGQSCSLASLCMIPYTVTCQGDADCGEGFTCSMSGTQCDCGGSSADVPDSAAVTPCNEIPGPPPRPPCDAGPACPPPPPSLCDSGTCLCWQAGTCMASTPSMSCTSSSACVAGWSCTSGVCEPPCYGDGSFGAAGSSAPPPSGTAMPTASHGGCAVGASDATSAVTWGLLAAAIGGSRWRRRSLRRRPSSV